MPAKRASQQAEATRVQALFERLAKANPAPRTELHYASDFQLLVAVVLSAQATDKSVNLATPALFAAAPTPAAMLALGEAGLESYIRSIGLYHTKAKNLLRTCALLLEQHAGKVPHERDALQALPGVGRKSANVLLNTLFGEPCIAVDTHVQRVAVRLGLSHANTPQAVERDLMACIPSPYLPNAHHWLVLHGRYMCKARAPLCSTCPLAELCPACSSAS